MSKPKIQYVYTCSNAIYNYLKDDDIEKLLSELNRCQSLEETPLMFRFGAPLLYTIDDIETDLRKIGHNNRETLLLLMEFTVNSINPDNELVIY